MIPIAGRRAGKTAEVLLNPEELLRQHGKEAERGVLETLIRASGASAPRVTLFWNSRNAGYLLRSLQAAGLAAADHDTCECRTCNCQTGRQTADLVLEAGGMDSGENVAVRWGVSGGAAGLERGAPNSRSLPGLFVPLPRQAWLGGYTEPSGRKAFRAGVLDGRLLGSLLI